MRVVLPDAVRPQLRALAAGVVNMAQEAYRRRLHLVSGDAGSGNALDERAELQTFTWTLGEFWPMIADVIANELRDYPELLDRVLVALANTRSSESRSPVIASR
jgi:hypothetical protein